MCIFDCVSLKKIKRNKFFPFRGYFLIYIRANQGLHKWCMKVDYVEWVFILRSLRFSGHWVDWIEICRKNNCITWGRRSCTTEPVSMFRKFSLQHFTTVIVLLQLNYYVYYLEDLCIDSWHQWELHSFVYLLFNLSVLKGSNLMCWVFFTSQHFICLLQT